MDLHELKAPSFPFLLFLGGGAVVRFCFMFQIAFELSSSLASASQMLGLQVHTTARKKSSFFQLFGTGY